MDEISGRFQRAERQRVAPKHELRDDRGDHRPGRLPRTVGIEGPHDDRRQAEAPVERFDHRVRGDLARGVGGLRAARVRLRHRHGPGRSIHLARRGVDEAPHLVAPASFRDVEGSEGVDLKVHLRRGVRVGNRHHRAKVQDRVATANGDINEGRVEQIALDQLDLAPHRIRQQIKAPVAGSRAVADERAHVMSQGDEALDEMAADEPGGTRDESSGKGSAHHRSGLIISDSPPRGNRFSAVARGNMRVEGPSHRAGFLRRARV